MTLQSKQNLKALIPYLSFIPMLYIVFALGQNSAETEIRLKEIIPYDVLVEKFVPRNEIETMKEDIKEIKKDVKIILLKTNVQN